MTIDPRIPTMPRRSMPDFFTDNADIGGQGRGGYSKPPGMEGGGGGSPNMVGVTDGGFGGGLGGRA